MESNKELKKVTIISLDNWNFNHFIKTELESKGIEVNHINFDLFKYKYPSVSYKILNSILKTIFNYNLKRVHLNRHILTRLKVFGKQDKILVIKGDNLSKQTLNVIKKDYCNELIAFFNDSFARYPRMKSVSSCFDTIFSFEPKDAKRFNFKTITNYIYFPIEKFKVKKEFDYNVFNISSLDKRAKALPILASYLQKNKITNKLIAFSNKKKLDKFKGIDYISQPLSLEEMNLLIDKSKTILDIQRPKQEGLSFRVFEALGKHKKLITTNASIKEYDFYNPNNIVIIDLENIEIDSQFFKSPYEEVDDEILEKYHVSNWVDTVFDLKKN